MPSALAHHDPDAPLDLPSRRRLLESVAARGSTEVAAVTLPGLLVWAHGRDGGDVGLLLLWWAGFVAFAVVVFVLRRRFQAHIAAHGDAVTERWERVFRGLSLLNGACWSVPVFLTMHDGSHEFKLLLYLALCGVLASAASFLGPVPGMFVRFFAGCYLPLLAAVVWVFPERWPIVLPLTLIYGVVICRHAWGTRHFVRQQIALERDRAALADQYRLARDRAELALAEKQRFLSTASHDLRQPVHAMGMLVEAALARNTDGGLAPVLVDVQRCTRSLTVMFDALLDLSRIEAGTFSPTFAAVSLEDLFEEVATVFGPDAQGRGLQLRLKLPRRRPPLVRGDPTLLRQITFNLVQNALRYTQRGGVLAAVRPRGDGWRLEVRDTGTGVAAEDRARIFSPFFRSSRADAGTAPGTPPARGLGLGLAVVARCAELMGARFGFDSTPGRGSVFWVDLPAMALTLPSGPPRPKEALGALSGRCLLVDDDLDVGAGWSALLGTWGLDTRVTRSRAEALACLEAGFAPDAILCDLRLAGDHCGYALLQELLDRCPSARGAMVSGEFDAPELVRAEDEGHLVFRKPVEPDLLHAVLARWLSPA